MNYFEFYGFPICFHVDEAEVKRRFYELSKKYHPDFYISEPAERQQEILELSTLNNKAYAVLSNPLKRAEYILSLNDLVREGEKYQLPQEFLMEMMEVNEALMEQEFDPDAMALEEIKGQVDQKEANLFSELHSFTSAYDAGGESDREEALLKIKEIWYRQKYLMRIRDTLNRISV
ncbi:MAG TPA: Fe-S protein assembly co-chaperone HscB [Sphingobacteriaceae bacterium]